MLRTFIHAPHENMLGYVHSRTDDSLFLFYHLLIPLAKAEMLLSATVLKR